MRVFVAEKHDVAKAIAKQLNPSAKQLRELGCYDCGNDKITWVSGHFFDNAPPHSYNPAYEKWQIEHLPINPGEFDDWIMHLKPSAKKQFSNIKKLIKQADEVVHAGDPDREGQLIVDDIIRQTGFKGKVSRYLANAVTDEVVSKALNNLKSNTSTDFIAQGKSALTRRCSDWLVGMNLTRAYTIAARNNGYRSKQPLSVGRVQSPVLNLIVQREREINNFVPIDHYKIEATFVHENGSYTGTLKLDKEHPGVDAEGRLVDHAQAQAIMRRLENKMGKITGYSKKKQKQAPPLPFNLSKLQIAAGNRYKIDASKTLEIAQALYSKHQMTYYPRTDSQHLPEDLHGVAGQTLQSIQQLVPEAANANSSLKSAAWNSSKTSAHHAIIPTGTVKSGISDMEMNIFRMISLQYVAQFYPNYEYESTNIETTVEHDNGIKDVFVTSGKVDIALGWKAILSNAGEKDETQSLPTVKEGDQVKVDALKNKALKTKPPKRFDNASLISAMTNIHLFVESKEIRARLKETDGLGTEATRHSVPDTLEDRGYIKRNTKKEYVPQAIAYVLIDCLPSNVKDPGMTALWENGLKAIETGDATPEQFIQMQIKSLTNIIQHSQKMQITIPKEYQSFDDNKKSKGKGKKSNTYKKEKDTTDHGYGFCSACKSSIVKRTIKNGDRAGESFLACSGYPECKVRVDQSALTET